MNNVVAEVTARLRGDEFELFACKIRSLLPDGHSVLFKKRTRFIHAFYMYKDGHDPTHGCIFEVFEYPTSVDLDDVKKLIEKTALF